jgi:hypothetical protein
MAGACPPAEAPMTMTSYLPGGACGTLRASTFPFPRIRALRALLIWCAAIIARVRITQSFRAQAPLPRLTTLATTMASSLGSTGLGTCIWNPAIRARNRSSDLPKAVRAMAGV